MTNSKQMRTTFTIEERCLNRLVLNSANATESIGLLSGQMGVLIVLVEYARKRNQPHLENIADFLYDNIMTQVVHCRNISFGSGLSGICWGIEYLVQHQILNGSADEICREADDVAMRVDIAEMTDFSIETGLLGLWHYVWARIQGNLLAKLALPFSEKYLLIWDKILSMHKDKFPNNARGDLVQAKMKKLRFHELRIQTFINSMDVVPNGDISLQHGLAGYIKLHYLK